MRALARASPALSVDHSTLPRLPSGFFIGLASHPTTSFLNPWVPATRGGIGQFLSEAASKWYEFRNQRMKGPRIIGLTPPNRVEAIKSISYVPGATNRGYAAGNH